jgi:hypothetical protein
MPAQTNATLSRVQAAGTSETFDGPPAAGPDKWVAPDQTANAYVKTRRRRVTTAAGSDVVLETTLIVDSSMAVDWRAGDVVTYARTGGTAETRTVETVEVSAIDDPAFTPDLVTTRLGLVAS